MSAGQAPAPDRGPGAVRAAALVLACAVLVGCQTGAGQAVRDVTVRAMAHGANL